MTAFYNEIEPYPARWLRNLAAEGHVAPGVVDERSIVDVRADDLVGHEQVHFFAGIGGWSRALRLAGWPDEYPVWTGSCPCQPFAHSGKGRAEADERHLWPEFRRLIAECRPSVVVGEQTASAAGRRWLASVRLDLEDLGYAVGAADLCAAGVGAPHRRQRLFWGAHRLALADEGRRPVLTPPRLHDHGERRYDAAGRGASGSWDELDWLPSTNGRPRPTRPGLFPLAHGIPARVGKLCAYGNAIVPELAAVFVTAFVESI